MQLSVLFPGHGGPVLCLMAAFLHVVISAPPRPSSSPVGRGRTEFNDIGQDGSYRFGYSTGDAGQHYHSASATADNTVSGQFGYREPGTGRDLKTTYTAGRRGFRANGPHIARKMDLSQNKIPYNPPVSPDSPHYNPTYDTYFDPNEDPSYEFGFNTPVYTRKEKADSRGDVNGHYTYFDDVGLRHDVEYEAGSRTGFHVKTPYPESNSIGGLFFHGPLASKTGTTLRGHTAIQRFKNGAYRFTAVGPDQRRQEESDSVGNVRGSYTYLDDKGVQRTTEYIAGPNIGYKVINSELSPQNSNSFPYLPPPYAIPTPFEPSHSSGDGLGGSSSGGGSNVGNTGVPSKDDDIFGLPEGLKTAASGSPVKRPQDSSPVETQTTKTDDKDGSNKVENDNSAVFDVKPSISTEIQPPKEEDSESRPNGFTNTFNSNSNGNENDDIFGPKQYSSESNDNFLGNKDSGGESDDDGLKSASEEGFLTSDDDFPTSQTGTSGSKFDTSNRKIPYGNCCSSAGRGNVRYNVPSTRQADKRHNENKFLSDLRNEFNDSPKKNRDLEQDEERFLGFPPGVAVRARVQSIDLPKYGSRLPPPGEALEYSSQFARKTRRQIRRKLET